VTLKTRKFVLFVGLFAVWLVADVVTKNWADTSLANRSHPQPLVITEAEAGKPLREVVAARFGWSAEEVTPHLAALERLEPAGGYAPTDKPYEATGAAAPARAFYVFWRGDRELPPRRIEKNERYLVARWLSAAFPKADAAAIQRATYDLMASYDFTAWLPRRFKKLDADDVPALTVDRIHPVTGAGALVTGDEPVKAGETWLLTARQVDVMGDWFKLVYAENPNAAFGFLKGVDPETRYTLFMLLTLVAFGVILTIVWRLPAEGWFVYAAFAGILAGAAGNFIDRLRFHYVIDFIDMDLGFMHWPTYNVADIGISVGVVALLLDITFNKQSALVSQKDREKRALAAKAKASA